MGSPSGDRPTGTTAAGAASALNHCVWRTASRYATGLAVDRPLALAVAKRRNAGNRAEQHGKSRISSSVFARSRSSSAHASSRSVAVSGGAPGDREKLLEDRAQPISLCRESPARRTWLRTAQRTSTTTCAAAPACSAGTARRESPHRAAPAAAAFTAARVSGVTGTRPSSSKKPMVMRRRSSRRRLAQCDRRADRIGRILPAEHAKQQRDIGDGPRHRPDRAENRKRPHARRQMAAARNASGRGLERADAREVRRHAHRAAAVAAQSRRRQPRRNRRRLAAARSARRALQIPRIARLPVQQVRGLIGHQKLGAVGRAQNQRARRAQPRHHHRIFVRNIALVQQAADLAAIACRGDRRLHGDRKAMQRPARLWRCIELPRLRAHASASKSTSAFELRIQPLDLPDVRFGQFGD